MKTLTYQKQLEVCAAYDVAVVGSGPAGLCAAVAAAEEGARVVLIERFGVLGGNLTIGHVSPILGAVSNGTMAARVVDLLKAGHPDTPVVMTRNGREEHLDHEEAKRLFPTWVKNSGVQVMLCTSVVDVLKEGNAVTGVIVETPTGLCAIEAKVLYIVLFAKDFCQLKRIRFFGAIF